MLTSFPWFYLNSAPNWESAIEITLRQSVEQPLASCTTQRIAHAIALLTSVLGSHLCVMSTVADIIMCENSPGLLCIFLSTAAKKAAREGLGTRLGNDHEHFAEVCPVVVVYLLHAHENLK